MVAFATAEDFATFIQQDLTAEETATVSQNLDAATSAIQGYTRQELFFDAEDTITLPGTGKRTLLLPQIPVVAITEVTLAGVVLDAADYSAHLVAGILTRPVGYIWGEVADSVVVKHSHGFEAIPDDLKIVCLSIAARMMENPDGVNREQIGGYGVTYAEQFLTASERALLDRYRP